LRWNTATAGDRDLFQSPFRAGIHQDAYQLLPLRKALRLPRVNLLIADDVGAGKTVEAGLILRELLLRRRIDFVLVAPPAGMVRQWQDELEAKFGLTFTIVDREYLTVLRRERGYGANPWAAGSRFLISHSLMSDETYIGGLSATFSGISGRARDADSRRGAPCRASQRTGLNSVRLACIDDDAQGEAVSVLGRATRSIANSPRRSGGSPSASSTGCSYPRRRTTAIPIRSRRFWRFLIRSALQAAFR
jgi:hypothetical protein